MADTYNKDISGEYVKDIEDLKSVDTLRHDEAFGENAARDFMAQNPDERFALFSKNPIGYMSSFGINPETEANLSDDVKGILGNLNSQVPPIYNSYAVAYASNFPNDKAKSAFQSLASSLYGVGKIENLTTEQFSSLMQNEQIQALSEEPNNKYYVQNLQNAFTDREKAEQYAANRAKSLQAIWRELQPLAEKKSKDILGIKDGPTANQEFSINPTSNQTNISLSASSENPNYTYDDSKVNNLEGLTVQGKVDDTPAVVMNGKVDDATVFSQQGSMENPNYTYDEVKGLEADPISVKGDLGNVGPTISVDGSTENKEEQTGQKTPDFSDGFKLSDDAKAKLKEKYGKYSVLGIMEDFASAQNPEDAFVAMFLGMLLYLPNKALMHMEKKEVEAKEKKAYIENRTQEYDDALAKVRGWSGNDQFDMVHKDFIENFGNMPEMAEKLRKEHPELVEGLGLKFDENGRLDGELKDKQIEALAKRVLENNYDKTYGHKPTEKQLKGLWTSCNDFFKTGEFARLAEKRAREQSQEENAQAEPSSVQAEPTPTQQQSDEAKPSQTFDPTAYKVNPNISDDAEVSISSPLQEETKSKEPEQIPVEDLAVNTQALQTEEIQNKRISVDAQPLAERPKMNVQAAHDFSLSISSPQALKNSVMQFNVSFEGVKTKEKEVQSNRDALRLARQPREAVNTNQLQLSVGPQQRV